MPVNKRKLWLLVGLITALIVGILFVNQLLTRVELAIYDLQLWFKSLFTINRQAEVVIVRIGDYSLEQIGSWPWPRSLHAQLVGELKQAGAKTIGFDLVFDLPSREQEDQALAKAIQKTDNLYLPTVLTTFRRGTTINIQNITYPLLEFRQAGADTGYLNLFPDRDGKIRRVNLITDDLQPLAFKLANNFSQQTREFPAQELGINFHHQANYFPQIAYYRVLTGNYPPDLFTNKLVLVGPMDNTLGDYFMTPVGEYSPGVRIQAEIIDNYLENSFIYFADKLPVIIAILLTSLLTAWLYFRLSPVSGLLVAGLLGIGFLMFTTGLLVYFNFQFPVIELEIILVLNLIISNLISYLQTEEQRAHLKTVFSRYLAPEVIEEVIALPERECLLGQRREITVLFVDLAGFTGFAEDKEADNTVQLLNEYFSVITEETFALEGTLDKFLGDGAMIFFGAPTDQVDHALRAVKLAINIQQKINQQSRFPLQVSIGINTGEAIVGNVGSFQRTDYTAIGNVVNTAARIEVAAKGGEIIIGANTYRLVKKNFTCQFKEQLTLRGKKQPNKLYQVIYKRRNKHE